MLSLYVLQAPGVTLPSDGFKKAFKLIIQKAELAYQEKLLSNRSFEHHAYEVYGDALKTVMQQYVNERLLSIPKHLEQLLTTTIQADFPDGTDQAKYVRECLITALDASAVEIVVFMKTFSTDWDSQKNQNRDDAPLPIIQSIENGCFKDYLVAISDTVYGVLDLHIHGLDLSSAVDLAAWLNGFAYYHTTSREVVSMSSHEYDMEEAEEMSSLAKARVASEINRKITNGIFSRIKEIVLRDVERYVPNSGDLMPESSTDEVSAKVTNSQDATNAAAEGDGISIDTMSEKDHLDETFTRLEKTLGPGIHEAIPPVKTAIRLLIYVHDLVFEYVQGYVRISSHLRFNHANLLVGHK